MFGRIAIYILHNVVVGAAIGVGVEATSHFFRKSAQKAAEKAEVATTETVNAFTKARNEWRKRREDRELAKAQGITVDEDGVIVG